jgi:predicted permease
MELRQAFDLAALRLRSLFKRSDVEDELDAELRDHIEQKTQLYIARGASAEEARRIALQDMQGMEARKEDCRDARGLLLFETLWQDLRYGARVLRKSPGFTAIAVLTLALGIGASTAVFSLVNAVLLKPLPYPHPERIVTPWCVAPPGITYLGFDKLPWFRPAYLFFEHETQAFQSVAAFQSNSFNLSGVNQPVRLDGISASSGFFAVMGVEPALGRTFAPAEDVPGAGHVVVLSDALWHEQFSADRGVLGQTIDLNGAPYTVIGVMPRGFEFPRANEMPNSFTFARRPQLWVPLQLDRGPMIPAEPSELAVIGRMKPGVTLPEAQAELNVMAKRLEAQIPLGKGWFGSKAIALSQQVAGDTRAPLLLILGAVGVVLLIACSNVASLLVTRSLGRRREFTLRTSLGAGKWRLIRQLLTESIVLAGVGGILGIALGQLGIHFAKVFGPASLPRIGEVSLDIRVVAFALGITLLTGILFGLAPTLGATREDLVTNLNEGGRRSSAGPGARKARNTLLVTQIALAVVLVIATGLLTRSFYRLLSADPGFAPDHVLTFELSLPPEKYQDQAHMVAFYYEALRRLRDLPQVKAAGLAEVAPLGGATENTALRIPGHIERTRADVPLGNYTVTSPGYFAAAGTPILRGREFLDTDTADSLPVSIISAAMAKKYFPDADPIGKQVAPRSPKYPLTTIVGIAADVKRLSLRDIPGPEMYVPITQKVWPSLLTEDIVMRTQGAPASFAESARETIHAIDPEMPLANIKTLQDSVSNSMTQPRFAMLLIGAFGGLALLLAMIGMYGVVSYSVAQRTQEIGIRVALGAQRRDVLRIVVGQGLALALIGIGIGLGAALGATRLMRSVLYEVGAADPITFAAVCLLMLAAAVLASWVPARRAMGVDPIVALRHE